VTLNQRAVVVALVFGFCIFLISALQPILAPFFVGALLAYLGDPLADRFEAWGMKRSVAASLVFLLISLAISLALLVVVPLLGHQLDLLTGKLPAMLEWLQNVAAPWFEETFKIPVMSLPGSEAQAALVENWQSVGRFAGQMWSQVGTSSLSFLTVVTQIVLIPVVAFYLLRDWDILVAEIRGLIPRHWVGKADLLASECDEVLGAFIRGQFMVMLALGAIYSVGLWAIGLQLAILVGVVSGLASIVPYMGFVVGILAASVAAYSQFGEWSALISVVLVYGVGQVIEGSLLTPLLVGDRIGLHPVAVIFAILAGGQLAGFVGILLALPVSAVIMVFLRHLHGSYKLSDWYNNDRSRGVVSALENDSSESSIPSDIEDASSTDDD
jgi:predicted PurR-regulated permease PerM